MHTSTTLTGDLTLHFAFDQPAQPKPMARKKSAKAIPCDPRHHLITAQWSERFERALGLRYVFTPRDAATLKRFLAGSSEGAEEFLRIADEAWERVRTDRFASRCKMAATLHGLCTAYNDIRVELRSPAAKVDGEGMRTTGLGRSGFALMP